MIRFLLLGIVFECNLYAQSVQVYETFADRSKLLERRSSNLTFSPGPAQGQPSFTIAVDDAVQHQTMDGFGASLTHSSAWLIANRLDRGQRRALLRSLFDPTYGIGISLLRQPMGASDFSARGDFSYADQPDPALTGFSIGPDLEFTIPLLREALAANPLLRILAVPWSPPGWMKTNGSMRGGGVRSDRFPALAQYFVKFLQAYGRQALPVYAVAMQNEPLYTTSNYPSAFVSPSDQAIFLGKHLGPALEAAGMGATKILAYDHNWDHPEYPETVLADPDAARFVAGTAFHCYGGDVQAQSRLKAAHPGKDIWFTECSGTAGSSFAGDLAWNARNLLIGATRNWARSVILWNIALDQNSGPKNGGCDQCRGVVTIDTSTTPSRITQNVEYYALGQVAKFVVPGAVRIDSESGGAGSILDAAFRNPDGSIALVVLNDAQGQRTFAVAWRGAAFTHTLPGQSVATFIWNTEQPSFPANGVVNAAHPDARLSPGALFSIYGTELAGETRQAAMLPLPVTMGGTSVSTNLRPTPLLYVSALQINAQIPWETETGAATLSIHRNGEVSSQPIAVSAAGPAIFTADGTRAAALNQDGSANSEVNPLPAGQVAVLFGTGFGPATPSVEPGEPASSDPLSFATGQVSVEVAGRAVTPEFAGLAPQFVGLFQVNFRVPEGTAAGSARVSVSVDGIPSNVVTLAVR